MLYRNKNLELRLAFLHFLGWGLPPQFLRERCGVLPLSAFYTLSFLGILVASLFFHNPILVYFRRVLFTGHTGFIIWGGILLISLPSIIYQCILTWGFAQNKVIVSGKCLKRVRHLPYIIFALIGWNEQEAHWYVIYADWEKYLRQSDAYYELEVYPVMVMLQHFADTGVIPLRLSDFQLR
jgi:hypothetical protein